MKKTHYRTFSKSKHLASDDLIGLPSIKVTIAKAFTGTDKNKKKDGPVPILEFKEKFIRENEPLKSMILNMTNMKTLEDISGSPYLEDWIGLEIEIYVLNGIRFGSDLVDGLRIRQPKPERPKKALCDDQIDKLVNSIISGAYSLDRLSNQFTYTDAQMLEINKQLEGHNEANHQM